MPEICIAYTNIVFDQETVVMQIIQHEVIDIDMDEDSDDIMFIDEKICANDKRKVIQMFLVFTSVVKIFFFFWFIVKYPTVLPNLQFSSSHLLFLVFWL